MKQINKHTADSVMNDRYKSESHAKDQRDRKYDHGLLCQLLRA